MKPNILALCIVTIMLASCASPLGQVPLESSENVATHKAGLIISVEGTTTNSIARSIVSDPSALGIDSYSVTLTSQHGYATVTRSFSTGTANFTDLEPGTWDIEVEAMVGLNVVASGSVSNKILKVGETLTVSIALTFSQEGTGGFLLEVVFPVASGIDYVQASLMTITDEAVGSMMTPSLVTTGSDYHSILSMSEIPSGIYFLTIQFKRGGATGSNAGVFGEAVNIWDNVVSDKWLDSTNGILNPERVFATSDFFSTNSALSSLTLSGSYGAIPLSPSFSSAVPDYTAATNSTILSFTAQQSIAGQALEYRLNSGVWIPFVSGSGVSSIGLNAGSNVLDLRVTAPDGTTQKQYTVVVLRVSPRSVTYDPNGASGGAAPVDSSTYLIGGTAILLGNTGILTKAHSIFGGWNSSSDGTGTSYLPGNSIQVGTTNITLYAIWVPAYSITYHANGASSGTVPEDSQLYLPSEPVAVLANNGNLAIPGTSLLGWNTSPDGNGADYAFGATIIIGATDVVLYACWQKHNIIYNGNGNTSGEVPIDTSDFAVGASTTVEGNTGGLVKSSFAFAGWSTSADGGGTYYKAGSACVSGTEFVTLYAVWMPDFLIFTEGSTGIEITGYTGYPSSLTNLTKAVRSIGAFAFNNCTSLTSVNLPEGVTHIATSAFDSTPSLASLSLPEGLLQIGDYAFKSSGIVSLVLPSSLVSLGVYCFEQTLSLSGSVTIPSQIKEIPTGLFRNNSGGYLGQIASITLPEGLISIGTSAFLGQSAFSSISIPATVETLGSGAFYYCQNLADVYLNSITPPSCDSLNIFAGTPPGITFHVPAGSLDVYQNDPVWSSFVGNIVE